LVYLVYLVRFVDLVRVVQPKNQTNQINQITNQTGLVPDVQAIEVHAVLKWFFRSLLDELRQNLVRDSFSCAYFSVGRALQGLG
jgi:hypothetical protein